VVHVAGSASHLAIDLLDSFPGKVASEESLESDNVLNYFQLMSGFGAGKLLEEIIGLSILTSSHFKF
jgi:hypothetical protein